MKKQTYKLGIYILVLAIIAGLGIWFGLINLWKSIQDKENKLQVLILNEKSDKKMLGQLTKLRNQNNLIEANKEKLEVFFNKEDALKLAKKLEIIANETNNKIIIKASPEKTKVNKSQKTKTATKNQKNNNKQVKKIEPVLDNYLTVTVNLYGTQENIATFIRKINSLPYLFNIISINISDKKNNVFIEGEKDIAEKGIRYKNILNSNNQNTQGKKDNQENTIETEKKYIAVLKIVFYLNDNLEKK